MKTSSTVEEVHKFYKKIHNMECNEGRANRILDDFNRYNEYSDEIRPVKSLFEFIDSHKDHEVHIRMMQEHRDHMDSLSKYERFLVENGFNDDLGNKIMPFVYNYETNKYACEEGKALIKSVTGVFFSIKPDDSKALMKSILTTISTYIDSDCEETKIDDFIRMEGDSVAGWFNGICGDGERAMRTILIIAKKFNSFCAKEEHDPSVIEKLNYKGNVSGE